MKPNWLRVASSATARQTRPSSASVWTVSASLKIRAMPARTAFCRSVCSSTRLRSVMSRITLRSTRSPASVVPRELTSTGKVLPSLLR